MQVFTLPEIFFWMAEQKEITKDKGITSWSIHCVSSWVVENLSGLRLKQMKRNKKVVNTKQLV